MPGRFRFISRREGGTGITSRSLVTGPHIVPAETPGSPSSAASASAFPAAVGTAAAMFTAHCRTSVSLLIVDALKDVVGSLSILAGHSEQWMRHG
jgi:hypothetical protein